MTISSFNDYEPSNDLQSEELSSYLAAEQARKSKLLVTFCLIFLVLETLSLLTDIVAFIFNNKTDLYDVSLIIFFLLASISSYQLAERDHYLAASRVLIIACIIHLTLLYYIYGSDAPLLIYFLLPIILASVLLDTRSVMVVSIVCIMVPLSLFAAQDWWAIYRPLSNQVSSKEIVIYVEFFTALCLFPTLVGLVLIPARMQAQLLHSQNRELLEALREVKARQQAGQAVSQQVRTLAAELKDSASQQAGGSYRQVSAVTQVDVSVSELSTTASNIADMAVQANTALDTVAADSQRIEETTSLSLKQSTEGLNAVQNTQVVSREVAQLYQEFLDMLDSLKQKNANMRHILQLLGSIASETHLLSLNAAIEAAGAGEAGDRFGVVAQEVKNLATRSSLASREVVEIIEQIEEASQAASLVAAGGYRKAQEMEQVVAQAGIVIGQMSQVCEQAQLQASSINQSTRQVKEITSVIRVATNQQRSASQQVLTALSGLRTVADENATGSQMVSSTAVNLEEMSRNLNLALTN